ncbi:DNA/RNA-binding protein Kin17, conserved region [Heracleum sosnowskyi]|uniref:DNA/RNA-binding protein Kin17, conserved region n=1 Tax=Heracleum sosnowskyi TaxID=360622 RepID=A0AAD8LYK0_9APIA|nr:DNA/RNA-binding protein Kin17, conserved region [Heracleum sosnowskyi]
MGKNDLMSPKDIANRIKAKGLQKLKYYCQVCRKICRDENGFKCHCMSEGHVRQMELFGQNPDRVIESYSEEFESSFLEHVKRSCRSGRVAANVVYNEVIRERHHVHMNATKWATLTEFVMYLGRNGKCKVEETEKGWFVTWVDRDRERNFREKRKRSRMDVVDEEKRELEIRRQIERASEEMRTVDGVEVEVEEKRKVLKRDEGNDSKVKIKIGNGKNVVKEKGESWRLLFEEDDSDESKIKNIRKDSNIGKSVLDELMREQEEAKEQSNRKDYWLCEGIVVKVMSKPLAEKGYYKQKGVVRKVIDKYVAEIEMIETKHVLRVDQEELETVIPQIGALVKIVNGAYRGSSARLLAVDTKELETGIPQIGSLCEDYCAYCGSDAKLLVVDTSMFCAMLQFQKALCQVPAVENEDMYKFCNDTSM